MVYLFVKFESLSYFVWLSGSECTVWKIWNVNRVFYWFLITSFTYFLITLLDLNCDESHVILLHHKLFLFYYFEFYSYIFTLYNDYIYCRELAHVHNLSQLFFPFTSPTFNSQYQI